MGLTESLLNLYRVDQQVRGLRTRLQAAERYHAAQQKLLSEVRELRSELETRRRHHQARIGNHETEGGVLDQQLEKFRNDLNSAATNKQYTAVLTELNTVKEARSRIDDAILAEMDEIERIEQQLVEVGEQEAERQKIAKIAADQLAERQSEIGSRLSELEEEREHAAAEVPPEELAIFESMADVHDGEAMAPVIEVERRRREYACGECNMMMPFERVSSLMAPSPGLVRCSACGRILYLQEETKGSLAPK